MKSSPTWMAKFGVVVMLLGGMAPGLQAKSVVSQTAALKTVAPKTIEAEYQLKASLVSLPVSAKVILTRGEDNIYTATIKSNARVIKITQSEQAKIENCQVDLMSIQSAGSRIGGKSWDESIEVDRDENQVTYLYANKTKSYQYAISKPLTGVASLFAQQYAMITQAQAEQSFQYTQVKKPVYLHLETAKKKERIKAKYFKKKVWANKIFFNKIKQSPESWYVPDRLGAFPVKMKFKMNSLVSVHINLKTISANEEELTAFFDAWKCQGEQG